MLHAGAGRRRTVEPVTTAGARHVQELTAASAVELEALLDGATNRTGGWSVIYRGTNTVLTHKKARLCARIGPVYETVDEAADTLNIVQMLDDAGAAVQHAAKPDPVLLRNRRHATFWELGIPVTEHDVTADEYVDALHSVHTVIPDRQIRTQGGSVNIRQGMLQHAATTDIPKKLLTKTARLFKQRLADVNQHPHRNSAVLHGDAWAMNMVRGRNLQIRWIDLDQAGWGPVEWDLGTCLFEARHYPTQNITEDDVLGRYRLAFNTELVEACVRLRAASCAVFTCFMWGREPGSMERLEFRLSRAERN